MDEAFNIRFAISFSLAALSEMQLSLQSSPMRTTASFLAALSLLLLRFDHPAHAAGCFSGPRLVQQDSYMTFEAQNDCANTAVVHYELRHSDGRVEANTWHVSKCTTARFQYFKGDYKFSVDVDDSKMCVPANSSRPDPNDNPSTSPGQPKVGPKSAVQAPNNAPPDFLTKHNMTRAQALQRLQGALDACTAKYPCNVSDKLDGQNNACVMLKRGCYKDCEQIPTMLGYPTDIIAEFCNRPSSRYP